MGKAIAGSNHEMYLMDEWVYASSDEEDSQVAAGRAGLVGRRGAVHLQSHGAKRMVGV